METKIKEISKSEIEVSCEMAWEEFKPYYDRAFEMLSKDTSLKGFRPGKAPLNLIEDKIGKQNITAEGADMAIKDKYIEIIKEKGFEALGRPKADVLKLASNNPFCFKITFQIIPEIKLPDYKEIAKGLPIKKAELTEKEVEEAIKWVQRSRAKFVDLETAAKKGDFVHIEYQSKQVDNERKVSDGFVLGEGKLIKGFEENLVGMKTGENKEFKSTFPDDYSMKELAGKEVDFKIKMEKVQKMTLPELNDDFAKSIGKFKTVTELKDNIRKGITQEKQQEEVKKWRNEILDKISQKIDWDIPEVLIESEQENSFQNLKEKVEKDLKISFEEYLKQIKKQEKEVKAELKEQAEVRVKNFLILREIGKKENIMVENAEIEQAINSFLTSFPQKEQKNIDNTHLKEYYKEMIHNQKVFQKLESF